MTGLLGDCYVVDVTEGAQGPFAASLLADLGATVVKVERESGELMRNGAGPRRNGVPLALLSISRGRVASVKLDLKSAEGHDYLCSLIARADVFIENWRSGTAERLGLGRQALHELNPSLVYLSASAFGSTGPLAQQGSMDSTAAASGGLASVSGERGGRTERYRMALLDFLSAMVTAEMGLAALLSRQLTGEVTWAETSQLESAVAVTSTLLAPSERRPDPGSLPLGSSDPWSCPSFIARCADGEYVAVEAQSDDEWHALDAALAVGGPAGWATASGRVRDRDRVQALVGQRLSVLPAGVALRTLAAAGVPASVVRRSLGEAMDDREYCDRHVAFRRAAGVGWIAMARPPWRFSDVAVSAGAPCPPLDTDIIENWRETWGNHE